MHRARNGEGSQLSYCVHHSPWVSINLEALQTPIFCVLMEASLHRHELVIDSTSSPFPSLKERKGSKFAESHHHLTCCYVWLIICNLSAWVSLFIDCVNMSKHRDMDYLKIPPPSTSHPRHPNPFSKAFSPYISCVLFTAPCPVLVLTEFC